MKNISALISGIAIFLSPLPANSQSYKFIENSRAWSALVADFNSDGHDDFFIHGHDGSNDRIWYWTPTGYRPSGQQFPASDRHACTIADYNADGRPDLYCARGAGVGTFTDKRNELWIQQSAGKFSLSQNSGTEDPSGRGRRPISIDVNNDGKPDIYLTNYTIPRADGLPNKNTLFIQQSDGTFLPKESLVTGSVGSWCVQKGDVNHDGWDDLIVCDVGETSTTRLFVNDKNSDFLPPTIVTPGISWNDVKLSDINGDGWVDFIGINQRRLQVRLNQQNSTPFQEVFFEDIFASDIIATSVAIGDFNGDGFRDLYVVTSFQSWGASESSATSCSLSTLDPPDILYLGTANGWRKRVLHSQSFVGCGSRAEVLDDNKVLIINGGPNWSGPHFIMSMKELTWRNTVNVKMPPQ